jgi:hypothetical protein
VSKEQDFSTLAAQGETPAASTTVQVLDRGMYYWRIRAGDGWEFSPHSALFSFWNPPSQGLGTTVTVHVTADGGDVLGAIVRIVASNGTEIRAGATGIDGRIQFTGVPFATYTVRVSASGYQDWSSTVAFSAPSVTLEVRLTSAGSFWVLLLLLLAVAVVILGLFWRRKRGKRRAPIPGPPPEVDSSPAPARRP